MPGPANGKRKLKWGGRRVKSGVKTRLEEPEQAERERAAAEMARTVEEAMFQPPFIHDPGNGPRVRDARMFLSSRFAQPVATEDALCAEFGQTEVLEMLRTVLPEETALIVWYNKSRGVSRVCPACQRLYRIGDVAGGERKEVSELQLREQELSGLCSPVCFVLASFKFPGAIKLAWGRTAEEMSDSAWVLLTESEETESSVTCSTLGLVVQMTRLDDLGLSQLCF